MDKANHETENHAGEERHEHAMAPARPARWAGKSRTAGALADQGDLSAEHARRPSQPGRRTRPLARSSMQAGRPARRLAPTLGRGVAPLSSASRGARSFLMRSNSFTYINTDDVSTYVMLVMLLVMRMMMVMMMMMMMMMLRRRIMVMMMVMVV